MSSLRAFQVRSVVAVVTIVLLGVGAAAFAAPNASPLGDRVRATEVETQPGTLEVVDGEEIAVAPEPVVEPDAEPAAETNTATLEVDQREAERAAAEALKIKEAPAAKDLDPVRPVAPDVDLSQPIVDESEGPELPVPPPVVAPDPAQPELGKSFVLLGEKVAPGTSVRLSWSPDQQFDGIAVPTPVLVVNGVRSGKTLCLTAAVHGDELNGIEIVRRVMYSLDPEKLSGTVVGVPIVNLLGFRRSSRYLPDRRDLNRFFPGNPRGSSASRIAHSFFSEVVRHCDALVDVHTGSFLRSNLPQLRADMTQPSVAALTEGFGATAVLHSLGTRGTLRRAATDRGIPAVTLETGEPSRLQDEEIEHGTKGILTLLNKLDLVRRVRVWGAPEPVYYQSTWVRAARGGLLFGDVKLGQRVREGSLLGTITDPITNVRTELRAPVAGRILGMALNQVVLPGFAAYRIGIPSTETEVAQPETTDSEDDEGDTGDSLEGTPIDVDIEVEDENS